MSDLRASGITNPCFDPLSGSKSSLSTTLIPTNLSLPYSNKDHVTDLTLFGSLNTKCSHVHLAAPGAGQRGLGRHRQGDPVL